MLEHVEGLPPHDVGSISAPVDAGEWEVALEVLCTQIYENDCDLELEFETSCCVWNGIWASQLAICSEIPGRSHGERG